ncbi:response regulator [Paenibacillus allorhizosphaerae]|uniref:Protein-glutamate methylesterase/protein-glutamine glutaminase n=1 Tax=Paenibacillus allorhizosphaerae TaxID=2849866 RepID=A0ABM8VV38_9BACL|nr:response regulator [Paenibacillus allorhizosphaerae]CAG7659191.1 Protein-glutamate methylesterase/protein-glutamine glutaminase [Paenibacillus allorhizosphaerae]
MYTIGEISKIVKTSVDALRYYDEISLLKPVHVEESNRYRYYSKEQISQLLLIIELKQYGFSLDAIRELLHNGAYLDRQRIKLALSARLQQLEIEKNALEKTVASVIRRINEIEGDENGVSAKKILIVDDVAFMRQILGEILEKHGYLVVTAENGQQAVDNFADEKPDIVIMDINMPIMDGITATTKIKEMDKDAKILALSAKGFLPVIFEILEEGARDFIVKPFQEETILDALIRIYDGNVTFNEQTFQAIKEQFGEDNTNKEAMSQEMISKVLQLCTREYHEHTREEIKEFMQYQS